MKKSFRRVWSMVLSMSLVLGLFAGVVIPTASAASQTYQLTELLTQGKIKPLGRTQVNLAGDGITADWSGSGFDINVSGDGGTMTVGFSSNYTAYWAVLVDGTQIWRGNTAATTGSFSVEIPAGKHTVRVVKETQMSSSESGYSKLTTLTFGGTVEAAPANKAHYIEFVGDSITCGDGGLGEYEPGVKWMGAHDSATHSYAYYVAQKLNVDYSLVSRGGIGLFTGISEQEGTEQKKGMQHIYDYVSAYSKENGEYGFTRQPDAVVILLGANDSISSSDQYKTIEYWQGLMEDFIDQVRGKNPNAEIVLLGRDPTKTGALMNIVEARRESDPKLHLFYNGWQGNGSAALATQYAGHPNGEDAEYYADQVTNFIRYSDILSASGDTASYSDIPYYISESGNDSNDGKTLATAKKTLNATVNQARTDNGTFAVGSRVVIYVQGTVLGSSNNKQGLLTGGTLKDSAGNKVPVLITTYNYSGTKAVLNTGHAATNDGNGSIVFYNNVILKDIVFQSTTNAAKGYRDRNLYSGYNDVVFDNVTFDMVGDTPSNNSGWRVSCGTAFGTDALPAAGQGSASITFKNGDYTNLQFAAAVMSNGMWKSDTETIYDVPNGDFRLIIEDGAKMGTVYNRYGSLNVGASSVTINGGSVDLYMGTASGTSSAQKTYKGDINLTVNGGTVYGHTFATAGNYVTLEGNINTTIHGGDFYITPQSTEDSYDGYFFGGLRKCVVQDINTTITGGQFFSLFKTADVDSGYYFGVAGSGSAVNVTNKISGGSFVPMNRGAKPGHMGIFLGSFSGNITGTHCNEISGGIFDGRGVGETNVVFGSRGVNWATGKLVNIIGKKGTQQGPLFQGTTVKLGGGWAQVGATKRTTSVLPTADDCTDTVVVSNTIYGGRFGVVHLANSAAADVSKSYYSFIKGSVESDIYGGFFQDDVYGAGNGNIYGHVTTNVYGGHFKSLYGGQLSNALVYDGVELNIYGMDEYYPANPNDTWVFCGGNKSGSVPAAKTAGRDAIRLTIQPAKANELTLNTRIKVGDTAGTSSVAVSGGTFPRGFAVEGKTVGEALASGCVIFDATTGKKTTYAASDASVSGSVVVDGNADTYVNELIYYVSENGQDAYSGTSMVTPKETLRAVFSEIIADNGGKSTFPVGTRITIYVEGTVNNDAGASGSQQIGGGQVLTMSDIHDHVPVTITTYNFDGTNKAKIIQNHLPTNGGNASSYVVNDLYFKDIDLQSVTNTATGYCNINFYAAGCAVTFDNCYISTDGKATSNGNAWFINADHFATGGFNPLKDSFLPLYGSVTFKNGDYTNLSHAAAVGGNSIWRSAADGGSVYSIPKMYTSIIIEDGAHMGTVYNAFGTLAVGSSTVEIRGGIVDEFIGTRNGSFTDTDNVYTYNTPEIVNIVSGGTVKSFMGTGAGYYNSTSKAGQYNTINGNITNTISGGTVGGTLFCGTNKYVKLNGNLTNNFTGGSLVLYPTSTSSGGHGIFLAGHDYTTITGNVTNNITSGELGVQIDADGVNSGIWMGLRKNSKIVGNLTNNISGGSIWVRVAEGKEAAYAAFHSGNFSVSYLTGTLTNNITGGTFDCRFGTYYFGQQGVSGSAAKIVNVFGDQTTGSGPVFLGTRNIMMSGNFGRIGVTSNSGTMPAASDSTDTVVISNKIYGGTFGGAVYATVSSGNTTNVGYVKGSVETDVYGGTFTTFYATGNAPIFGRVKTNIHGGTFHAIYGSCKGTVYDGVELNIYGMTEGSAPTGIFNADTAKISTQTAGRDAVKLTIDPKTALTLSMPIAVNKGTVTGTTSALVTGGTYTNGFAIDGLKVKDVLATGLVPQKDSDKTVVRVTDTMTSTGTESVTLISSAWTADTAKLTLSDSTVTWDGVTDAKVPTETVKFHSSVLEKGTDYTVSYSRDGAATTDLNSLGTVTVTVTAKAPYSGTLTETYTIVRDDAVGAAIQAVTNRTNTFSEDTVTADDSAALATLKNDIQKVLTDYAAVLTEAEVTALQALQTKVAALEKKIADVATQLSQAVAATNTFDVATVTADNSDQLATLKATLNAISDGNLTEAQKTQKQDALAKIAQLQAQIEDVADALKQAKSLVSSYKPETVTARVATALDNLAEYIAEIPDGNLTAAQKAEKKALAEQVAALQKIVADVNAELEAVKTEAEKYDATTVNADNVDEVKALIDRIQAIPDGNLTTAQKTEKKELLDRLTALYNAVADANAALEQIKAQVAQYKEEGATSDDQADLESLLTQLDTLAAAGADKTTCDQLKTDIGQLLEDIAKAAASLKKAEELLKEITPENVTTDDLAALDAMVLELSLIPDKNLTEAEKKTRDEMMAALDAMMQKVDAVNNALAAAVNGIWEYEEATVTADDQAAIEKLKADLTAISDGNLTEEQRDYKADALARANKLLGILEDVEDALTQYRNILNQYKPETTTARIATALEKLVSNITAIPDGNLTAAQKAEKQAMLEQVAALQKIIADVAKALEDATAAVNAFDPDTVTSDDAEALEKLASDIAAIPDGNLTNDQKAEKKALADQVAAMQKTLADTTAALKALEEQAEAADDKEALEDLIEAIEALPEDHLTEEEKKQLEELKQEAEQKLEAIEKAEQIAGDLGAIEKLLEGKTEENVTSEDEIDLLAAQKAIEELEKNQDLTEADKAKLAQLKKTVEALLKRLEEAEKAAQVSAEVEEITPETVEMTDKEALEEAIAALEEALENYEGNYTEAEKKAIEAAKAALEEALAVLKAVEAVEEQIAKLPETAEPDDEAAIEALRAAVAAYTALSERQQAMVSEAALDRMDALAAALLNYKVVSGADSTWTKDSDKSVTVTVNGLLSKFVSVELDGKVVDPKHYTARSGSTILTFHSTFLEELSEGKHTVTIHFTDGKVETTLTVKAKAVNPETGDTAAPALLLLVALASAATAAALMVDRKRRAR